MTHPSGRLLIAVTVLSSLGMVGCSGGSSAPSRPLNTAPSTTLASAPATTGTGSAPSSNPPSAPSQQVTAGTTGPTASASGSCTPATFLPVLGAALDNAPTKLRTVRVVVGRCRNGYAQVTGYPDTSVCKPGVGYCYDPANVLLAWQGGRWKILDVGEGAACQDPALTPNPTIRSACLGLGYRQLPICTTGQLRDVIARVEGAAGSRYVTVTLTNTAPAACWMYGYPDVHLLDADRNPLTTTSRQVAPTERDGQPIAVALSPSGRASFVFQYSAVQSTGSTCPAGTLVSIRTPGAGAPRLLTLTTQPCNQTLYIRPVTAVA